MTNLKNKQTALVGLLLTSLLRTIVYKGKAFSIAKKIRWNLPYGALGNMIA